jgi:hypothetical protein
MTIIKTICVFNYKIAKQLRIRNQKKRRREKKSEAKKIVEFSTEHAQRVKIIQQI